MSFTINNQNIGPGNKPYIIAEISGNHNGSKEKAIELIHLAKKTGASAVKLQTYTADTMTIKSDREEFWLSEGLWKGKSLYDLYEWAHTPWDWHKDLFSEAKKLDITIFSSPFDETAVDFLESLNAPAYKVASFEMTDYPLIEYIAKTGKPMIVSTGMANMDEIKEAQSIIEKYHKKYAFLHCVSGYPAPHKEYNLKTIHDLKSLLNCPVGLSDHTLGTTTAVASIALGACIVEKHFTFSRAEEGPDNKFSLEPQEFTTLVNECNIAHEAMGCVDYKLKKSEVQNKKNRRSIYVIKDIKKGETISPENIRRIRPGLGLEPKYYHSIIGKTVNKNLEGGTPLSLSDVDNI